MEEDATLFENLYEEEGVFQDVHMTEGESEEEPM